MAHPKTKIKQEQLLKRVYEQGQSVFYDGGKEEDCDYFHIPDKLSVWTDGFRDAQDNIEDWQTAVEKILGLL